MTTLQEIKAPVAAYMDLFETKFRASMKGNVPLLNLITRYLLKRKGKQMRPVLVFLSADICGEVKESTYTAASLIELLHTATLVHDDVVDDSNQRRGFFSVNAIWKNKAAVLVGDYLYSKGLLISLDNNEYHLLRIVSNAVREMSEGELLQIEKARSVNLREDIYFEIIRKKTASLIASCCACGAASVGSDKETIDRMFSLGESIGMAFQLKDDLFDYETTNSTGKPKGLDIREQKTTLPLIYLLNNSSYLDKRKYMNIIKNHNEDSHKVAELINKVNDIGGVDYAKEKMKEYQNKALDILKAFPESESRTAFEQLILFTTQRDN